MKPDFSTPRTLVLAAWVEGGQAAITGSLLDACGDVWPDAVERCGSPWDALLAALRDGLLAGPRLHLLLLCNDAPFVLQVRGQLPPAATGSERVWEPFSKAEQASSGRKGEWLSVPTGGDETQWECLRCLGMWPRSWRVMVVADLPKARERWEQQCKGR